MLSNLLLPFSFLYDMGSTLYRSKIVPVTLPVPVIVIGNLTAGGSGKTPVALHIGGILRDKNAGAFFLSRGYGGTLAGPVLVDAQNHNAAEVGDEPLLLAKILPTVVAKDRLAGARFAIAQGARAIVMDDGFQNPAIVKSLSLVVIDGRVGFGNGRVIPAGPLREFPAVALKRAHAVIALNPTTHLPKLPAGMAVLTAKTRLVNAGMLKGKKIIAFCGIAYPGKFFDMLSGAGANLVDRQAFADHKPYSAAEINKLIMRSSAQKIPLVTTAKDEVRIPADLRECVAVVDMAVEFDDEPLLEGMLDYILKRDEKI